ncbi:hypothetical protein [Rhodococcus sp. SGAir0479]|uniref:hypothetical protein n=1 Tax=Rhodococcus sp. SGAir0479 TaxID=2567884 RepID=UPI0010CCFD41|nr:hypothetical protein [Rhodococcus sp. SGAir0479]QCQ91951.1 hypothetical protein E7742_12475 [Rhodococcus sp. SGAir0479]
MSEHQNPRRRLRTRSVRQILAVLGVLAVAVVGVVAYFAVVTDDAPRSTDPDTSLEAGPADDPAADALARARRSLQQANLPLSMLGGGVDQLVDGGRRLDDGARQLSDGLGQARAGAQQLSDGVGELNGGVGRLGDGAQQISGGVDEVVDRLTGFGRMQAEVTGALRQVASTLSASADPVAQGAAGRVDDLVARIDTEGLGPDTLSRLATLKDGARQLSHELNDPSAAFVGGVGQVAEGARQLSEGLVLLDDGGRALADGTGQLVDGTGPITHVVQGLSTSVTDASKALPGARTPATDADRIPQAAADVDGGGTPGWVFAAGAVALLVIVGLVRGAFVWGRRSANGR